MWGLRLRDSIVKFIIIFPLSELSIELLKRETKVTDDQLDSRIEEADLPEVAACFDNTEDYVEKLGLSPGQQTDVRTQTFVKWHSSWNEGSYEALEDQQPHRINL